MPWSRRDDDVCCSNVMQGDQEGNLFRRGRSRSAYGSFMLPLLGFLTRADSMNQQIFLQVLNILLKEQMGCK